jgi:hypothetical protein
LRYKYEGATLAFNYDDFYQIFFDRHANAHLASYLKLQKIFLAVGEPELLRKSDVELVDIAKEDLLQPLGVPEDALERMTTLYRAFCEEKTSSSVTFKLIESKSSISHSGPPPSLVHPYVVGEGTDLLEEAESYRQRDINMRINSKSVNA